MLIATNTAVYSQEDGQPAPIFEGQKIARVAEGRCFNIVALTGGDLVILSDGNTQTLSTGIEEPIESGNIDTYQVAFSQDGTAWSIVENTLYRSDDRGASWNVFWEAPETIEIIACKN